MWLHHKLMQLILRSICLIVFQIQLNHVVLNGTNRRTIVNYNGCACAAIHPQNGDLYFTHFQKGHLYRVKKDILQEFVDGTRTTAVSPGTGADYMFTVQDKEWEFNIIIHPTGNYAYLMVINKHYIFVLIIMGVFTTPTCSRKR